jgi:hypothetical protein
MADASSALAIYSLGQVANNKSLGSNTISVTPIEKLTMLDGELVSNPVDRETTGTDVMGKTYQTKVTTDSAIEADWLPMNSNRVTAPDVRRGERVIIWKAADTNKFYWTETGWDDHLRKLETVVFQISATQDEEADSTAKDNSYYLYMSSHTKNITLKTSKANGEYCTYAFQFNLEDGIVTLTDDVGNEFSMDSKNAILYLKNRMESFLELNQEIITASAPDTMYIKAKNLVQVETEKLQVNAPNSYFSGNVFVAEQLEVSDDTILKANLKVSRTSTFGGKMSANGITSSAPIQGPSNTI